MPIYNPRLSTFSGFGSGEDGTYTLNAAQGAVAGLFTKTGTEFTLARTAFFGNLTIESGFSLRGNGFKLLVQDTFQCEGWYGVPGGDGGNGSPAGAGGLAGAAAYALLGVMHLGYFGAGAAGGAAGLAAGSAGTVGATVAANVYYRLGLDGGRGGTGGKGGDSGGVPVGGAGALGGIIPNPGGSRVDAYVSTAGPLHPGAQGPGLDFFQAYTARITSIGYGVGNPFWGSLTGHQPNSGGGGGGAGNFTAASVFGRGGSGGGSGAPGGWCWIAARRVIGGGAIDFSGGDGGNGGDGENGTEGGGGTAGGGGGGGAGSGGPGGLLTMFFETNTITTINGNGGAHGIYGTGGASWNAQSGADGNQPTFGGAEPGFFGLYKI